MNKFPKGYFEEENIEGFTVEAEMKHVWAAQLKVYKIIEEICIRHNIKLFGIWGTMLGAVRHNGFIPWDDDFDIGMLRDDYNRFLEIAPLELPEGYVVINAQTEPEWEDFFSRITNGHDISTSEERLQEYYGCPYAIGIDIFPFDYIPKNQELSDSISGMLSLIMTLISFAWNNPDKKYSNKSLEEGLNILESTFGFEFNRNGNLKNQLFCLFDLVCSSYGNSDDDLVCVYGIYMKSNGNHKFYKKWFDEIKPVSYENTTIMIPKGCDPILNISYSDKFMVPVKGAAGHDYPFYKEQRELLRENGIYDFIKKVQEESIIDTYEENVVVRVHEETYDIPDYWYEIKNDRKVILIALNSVAILKYGTELIEKLNRVCEIIKSVNNNTIIIWTEDDLFQETLSGLCPSLIPQYERLKIKIEYEEIGIVSDSIKYKFTEICDAYYGNGTIAMGDFLINKLPVMIMNVEI